MTSKTLLNQHPELTAENKKVKLLWYFEMRTDKAMPTRRSGMVVVDKKANYYNNRRSSTSYLESLLQGRREDQEISGHLNRNTKTMKT